MWPRPHQKTATSPRQSLIRLNAEALEDRSVPDATYHNLAAGDFSQDWSDPNLITTNDDWSGVPSIVGYRGDGLSSSTSTDPQTVLGPSTVVNVIAQSNTGNGTGGIHEIEASGTIALRGSGTADAPHLVIYLDTTGRQNINISYLLKELDSTNIDQKFALQYRIGGSGDFTNVPAGAVSGTFNAIGNQTSPVNVTLPSAVNNQTQVQIRIITNNAPQTDALVGIDDIQVTSEALPNDPPTVTTSSGTTDYTENDAATAIDPGLTATDSNDANLASATVQITGGYVNGQDVLGFTDTATITGSFDAASGKLTLTGSDTVAHYQDALRAVTYVNTSDAPSISNRTITFIANDGTANSTAKTKTVTVTAVNDAPAGMDQTRTIDEDTTYTFNATEFGFSDPNDTPANSLLALKITTLPEAGSLVFDGNAVSAGQVIPSGQIGLLQFAPAPNASDIRGYATFTFQVQDNGGTASGGVDLDQTPNNFTFKVRPVNDPPVVTLPGGPVTYTENDAPVLIDATATVTDIDNGNFDSGSLTISFTSGGTADDRLGIINQGTGFQQLGVNGNTVTYNSGFGATIFGTFTGGTGTTPLVFQFNASAQVSIVETLLRNITYSNVSDNPSTTPRNLQIVVVDDFDSPNNTSAPVSTTVNVTAVNDTPTLDDPADTSATAGIQKTVTLTGITAGGGETQGLTVTATSDTPGIVPNPSVNYTSPNSTGSLVFTPLTNGPAVITVRVTDDNSTPSDTSDDLFVEQQFTVNVSANQVPVNTGPTSVTAKEDIAFSFTGANTISTADPDSTPGNLTTVVSVPVNRGTLSATGASGNGTNVLTIVGSASAVNAALATLVYTPPSDGNSASFGGDVTLTLDTTDALGGNSNDTITITVTPVNDPPSFAATNPPVVNEDDGTITVSGFASFSPGGGSDEEVQTPTYIVSNVSNPGLFAITPSIDASGTLTYTLNSNASGSSTFDVTVQDSGGTADGGVDTSFTQTFTLSVNSVNDAPSGTDKTVTIDEDTDYAFTASDFGFSDPSDSPANNFVAVKITTLPTAGMLTNGGNAVNVGDFIPLDDINAGKLTFTPGANDTESVSFTFQVQDEGSGSNLDPTPNTITINVTAVNDQPSVSVAGDVTVNQDSGTFNQSGFATFAPGGGLDEAGQTPTYLLTNTNNALFSSQPTIDASGKLNFTLASGANGTAVVTVNASDSGPSALPNNNFATPVQFTITVEAVVVAPPVAAQPVSVAVSSTTTGARYIAIGSDAGTPSRVRILSATTGALLADFSPFGAYSGGVRVAVGDITGDGTDDIIIATAGTVGMLEVIDGRTGAVMGPLMPFGSFPSGLEIALGDIDGDGRLDLVLGVERGASTVGTFAFSGRTGQLLRAFDAFPGFDGGIRLAVGDVNGDHKAEIVVAAGPGMNGAIAVYDGATGNLLNSFTSHAGYPGEVNIAMGDLDGDGKAEIITTAQAGTFGTQIEVFNEQGQIVKNLFAPTSIGVTMGFDRTAGIAVVANQSARVAAADVNGDHIADILLADPPGTGSSKLLVLDGKTGAIIQNPFAFDPLFGFGVFVGMA